MNSFFATNITDKTQADGAQTIDVSGSYSSILATGKERFLTFPNWQLQVVPSEAPSGGTISIAVKIPGASDFADLTSTIDMSGEIVTFSILAEEIKLTPSGFDADKTYSVYLCAT